MKIFTAITICLFTTAGQANAKDLRLTSLDAQNYVPYNRDYPISIQFDVANASKNDYEIIALCVTVEREKQKCHSKSSMVNWNARRLKIRENWKGEGEKTISAYVKYRHGSWEIKKSNTLTTTVSFGY